MDQFDLTYEIKPPGYVMAKPNFIELPTRDLAASQVFFESVFGMKMTGFGPTYACTLTGDVDIGLQADQAEASKAPLPVIEVKDLEATLLLSPRPVRRSPNRSSVSPAAGASNSSTLVATNWRRCRRIRPDCFGRGTRCRNTAQKPSCSSAPATTTAAGSPKSCSTPWPARWGCRGRRHPGGLALERGVNNVGPMATSAIKALEAMGIRAGDDFARLPVQVTTDDLEQADRIVALKQAEHLPLLQERFPAWAEKVEFWHVDDAPEVLGLIEQEVMGLVARILGGGERQEIQPAETCRTSGSQGAGQEAAHGEGRAGRQRGGEAKA